MNLSALGKIFAPIPWKLLWQPPLAVPPRGAAALEKWLGARGHQELQRDLCRHVLPCPVCPFFVGEQELAVQAAADCSVCSLGGLAVLGAITHSLAEELVPAVTHGPSCHSSSCPGHPSSWVVAIKAGEQCGGGHEASGIDCSPALP